MLKRIEVEGTADAYYNVETILANHKDYYLTKEEIYAEMPVDENNVPLITISSLENALRTLARVGCIKVNSVRGVRYFAYEENKRGY